MWEEFTSTDPGLSVWEEFPPVLTAEGCAVQVHAKFTATTPYHFVPCHILLRRWADGQPLPTQHQDAMVKWQQPDTKMKQINSGVSYGDDQTTAQHDNVHKPTQALRLPPERRFFLMNVG